MNASSAPWGTPPRPDPYGSAPAPAPHPGAAHPAAPHPAGSPTPAPHAAPAGQGQPGAGVDPAAAASSHAEGDGEHWAQRHAELEARHQEVSDAYLRAKAEVENIRRRADEDIAKSRKFALEGFAESLLPVIDSLEAAVAAGGTNPDAKQAAMLEGVHATLRQLLSALERNRVVPVAPKPGDKFDPAVHQAISVVPSDQPANTVATLLQKGYQIAERVLRPALVTVAAPK